MAEERNLGLARAPEASGDSDATKAELQRRREEARESISQTVTEIKDTVVNQYQQVRETISDTLDWREQYRRRPLPFTIGAAGLGFLLGYSIMGAFKSDGDDYEEEDEYERAGDYRDEPSRSYAAAPIIGRASAYQRASVPAESAASESAEDFGALAQAAGPDTRPSYSSGYQAATSPSHTAATPDTRADEEEEEEEEKGPSLFSRFKETKAYDKLTDELSTVGERVVEELSRTAQAIVVPLLLNKLKSLIGVDLSPRREPAQSRRIGQQSARADAAPSAGGSATDESATGQSATGTGGATGGAAGTGGSSAYTAAGG